MLDFKIETNPETGQQYLATNVLGKALLTISQLNKGTAFSHQEREQFELAGKLPKKVETLEEQCLRAYKQYRGFTDELKKNIYLANLLNKNQVLFYKLVIDNFEEILPTIYTPYISYSVETFSTEFRSPRGIYISYSDADHLDTILDNRSNPAIDVIVVTDGESILGIGDQGLGGMDIPIAKLVMYTTCGGIQPLRTLPIFLDVGTNNQELLDDPFYLGLRQKRVVGEAYNHFIDKFVTTVQEKFPNVFLHWEDFSRLNAQAILDRYQDQLCTFNDDIQGTGIVSVAALLAAAKVSRSDLPEHRIVIFGGGAAGVGVGTQIIDALMRHGLTKEQAQEPIWMIDRQGLLLENDPNLTNGQQNFARASSDVQGWKLKNKHFISLEDTVNNIKPTILIGCSACANAFTQSIIQTMAKTCERPIIFPLSNPTERAEATPEQLLTWTNGKALIATGSPFTPVKFGNQTIDIAQCNNVLAFPGIGLGIITVGSKRFTPEMMWQASVALSQNAPSNDDSNAAILPPLTRAQHVAKEIAIAVAQQSIKDGLATRNNTGDLTTAINENFWHPIYLNYVRTK